MTHETRTPATVTGPTAARIAGLTFRVVDYLDRKGLVVPTIPAQGSGSRRGYTVEDLVVLSSYRWWRELAAVADSRPGISPELFAAVRAALEATPPRATASVSVGPMWVYVDVADLRRRVLLAWPPGETVEVDEEEAVA